MSNSIPRFELDRDFGSLRGPGRRRAAGARAPEPGREPARAAAEARPQPVPAAQPATPPDRYRVRKEGRQVFVTCIEAPTVRVRVERGFSVTAAEARAFDPGAIFLDGAARGEPFLDPERSIYNLDHHEGCVRPFTLSTCEQAMVLVRRGLDLRKREWTVYANDADLDTLLAIWVLLNHLHLARESSPASAAIMPLLRLQGVIDAQGLELQDLCALPAELMRETRARMDRIRGREVMLRARGRWSDVDLAEYVADRLRLIDAMIYDSQQFRDVQEIEELERLEIGPGSIAVVCRSRSGIYEVEKQLRRLHGDRLGVIVLQKDRATYSLRQVDPNLPSTLDRLYDRLNLVDPAAGGSGSANRWGGSGEIGGSPRQSGTRATPRQIARECQLAFRKSTLRERALRTGAACGLAAGLALAALAALAAPLERLGLELEPAARFAGALALLVGLPYLVAGHRAPGLYGLRAPSGRGWWLLLPPALAAALAGGVLSPALAAPDATSPLAFAAGLGALAALPLGTELLFRGLVQGRLARGFPMQRPGGAWFVSRPALAAAACYALFVAALLALGLAVRPSPLGVPLPAGSGLAAAFVFGLAAGMARERAESVLAPLLLQGLALVAALAAPLLPF